MSDFIAPRADGSLARYKLKYIGDSIYAVDQEMSKQIVDNHDAIPRNMKAADRFYDLLSGLILVVGFILLIWLPWYTPIISTLIALIIFRATKSSAADFVANVASTNSDFLKEMENIKVCIPKNELKSE